MNFAYLVEVVIILYVIALYIFMIKHKYKNIARKSIILIIGILLFEFMSEPMFENIGFHSWSYLYKDITWIVTLEWLSIIFTSIIIVDYLYSHLPEKRRFWLYLLFIEGITVPIEIFLVQTGIRKYAELLTVNLSGLYIPFTSVPIEGVFAIPAFTALILCFYKYVNHLFYLRRKNA